MRSSANALLLMGMFGLSSSVLASPFTMTSPTTGGALPSQVSPVGGVVLDLIGTNNARVLSQTPASTLFVGYFDSGTPSAYNGNPGTIGKQTGFNSGVMARLGGGLNQIGVRITLSDGDTASGNFDHNQNRLLINGINVGNWSSVDAQETDSNGVATGGMSGGGFRDGTLDTGWFLITDPTVLGQIYASMVATGEVVYQSEDDDPYDNYYDFTQGISSAYTNVGFGPGGGSLRSIALTPLQIEVATALDAIPGTDPDIDQAIAAIQSLPDPDAQRAGLEMLGAPGLFLQAAHLMNSAVIQGFNIDSRINAIRRGGPQPTVSTEGLSVSFLDNPLDQMRYASFLEDAQKTTAQAPAAEESTGGFFDFIDTTKLGFFIYGNLAYGSYEDSINQQGGDLNTNGFTVGVDYRILPELVVGAAFGFADTETKYGLGSNTNTQTYSGALYATYFIQDNLFIDGMASYGWAVLGTSRHIVLPGIDQTARADSNGTVFTTKLRGVYQHRLEELDLKELTLNPEVQVRYVNVEIDPYTERDAGGLGLIIARQHAESLTASVGGTVSYDLLLSDVKVVPYVGAAWEYEFLNDARNITTAFSGAPGTTFLTPTDAPDRSYITFSAGVTADLTKDVVAFLDYNTIFGNTQINSHSFRFGFRLKF